MATRAQKGKVVLWLNVFHMLWSGGVTLSSARTRRDVLGWSLTGATGVVSLCGPNTAFAVEELPTKFDEESFLKRGSVSMPMGVSGQGGKMRPETGVVLRDGSDVSRDSGTGDVLAEILLNGASAGGGGANSKIPVLASFSSPWPLATGNVYDVECRDPATGDGAFLAVTADVGARSLWELKDSFFVDQLISPRGRFSFYGQPTDVKLLKKRRAGAAVDDSFSSAGDYRVLDLTFSTLSQSTQAEIPRRARIVATIPAGTGQAVMLVGSASALRWKGTGGAERAVTATTDSFRAVPAPRSGLKMRAKNRRASPYASS